MELIATCLFGLEKQLGEEIDALGCRRLFTMDGRVAFEGRPEDVARANVFLRLAERVYIRLGAFHAESFTELFDGVRALPLEDYIGPADAFPVKGHAIKSKLFSVPDCQRIVKKAAADRLMAGHGVQTLPEEGTLYQLEFFIFKDEATLMIDTTGMTLHKRGYRPAAGMAPLRETLAASLVLTAHLRPDDLLWDPFCGSGTIVIEAAMQKRRIAPGLSRRFSAMDFDFLPSGIFARAEEEARSLENHEKFEILGSDTDSAVLKLARENAARAGVSDTVRFFEADARQIKKPSPDRRGTVICNPPYGERMLTESEVEILYRDIGKAFRALSPWQIYLLTSHPHFEALYGRRADRVKRLYNGMIPCALYEYYKPDLAHARPPKKKDTSEY